MPRAGSEERGLDLMTAAVAEATALKTAVMAAVVVPQVTQATAALAAALERLLAAAALEAKTVLVVLVVVVLVFMAKGPAGLLTGRAVLAARTIAEPKAVLMEAARHTLPHTARQELCG